MTEKKDFHSCARASASLRSMIRFEHGVNSVGVMQRAEGGPAAAFFPLITTKQ